MRTRNIGWVLALDPAIMSGWALYDPTYGKQVNEPPCIVAMPEIAKKRATVGGHLKFGKHTVWHGTFNADAITKTKKRIGEPKYMRLHHLQVFLTHMVHLTPLYEKMNLVVEEAKFSRGKSAVEWSHKFRAAVELLVCVNPQLKLTYIDPNDLKYHALRKRRGEKDEMIEAAREMYGYTGDDDNEADALHLMGWFLDYKGPDK